MPSTDQKEAVRPIEGGRERERAVIGTWGREKKDTFSLEGREKVRSKKERETDRGNPRSRGKAEVWEKGGKRIREGGEGRGGKEATPRRGGKERESDRKGGGGG